MCGICDLEFIELQAMLRGLHIYAGMGIKKLILENDCLLMIK